MPPLYEFDDDEDGDGSVDSHAHGSSAFVSQTASGVDSNGKSSSLCFDFSTPAGRIEAFQSVHNSLQGHNGINRTIQELHRLGYFWPKMAREVTVMVAECAVCQTEKKRMSATGAEYSSLRQYTLFEEVSIDFIGPLPFCSTEQITCSSCQSFSGPSDLTHFNYSSRYHGFTDFGT